MKKTRRFISIFLTIMFVMLISACNQSVDSNSSSQSNTESVSEEGTYSNKEAIDNNNYNVNRELKVHYIDVGQADCILIQQGNENMLIDAGNNDDRDTLKSYLGNLGITEFKYVIGTHPHEDHIGSMDYIVNSFKIGQIYFPKATATTKTFERFVKAVKNKGMQFTVPKVGESFNLGEAKCTILAPNSESYDDLNNYSIVVKIEFGNNSFLFTGDAEEISEKEMLKNGLGLKADVLKVGHHGSSSSTSPQFLNAVNPKYAVISCGKNNDFGHPHKETLQKLNDKGISIYRTDEEGTIVATSDGNTITFNTEPSTSNAAGTVKKDSSNSKTSQTQNKEQDYAGVDESSSDDKSSEMVWIANNNTKVYHKDKSCSRMKNPKEISLEEANGRGLNPCNKCGK